VGGSLCGGMPVSLARLWHMGLPEILGRSRQEVSKHWDRIGSRQNREGTSGPSLEAFREGASSRFFPGAASDEALSVWVERMPWAVSAAVATADAAREGRFTLLGHTVTLGTPLDWHREPVSGRRSPLVHWSRMRPLDPDSVGDSKLVWELNRHQWLVALGQAYRVTGDEAYAETFVSSVTDWLRENPVGIGINWSSSLEVSFRTIAWCWSLVLFARSRALTAPFLAQTLSGLEAHARHVEKYLSYYYSPNTHLTGEALGLVYVGTLLPELGRARRFRRLGARILEAEAARQVLRDGVYFEQSTCYERYTVEILLHYLILARTIGEGAGESVGEAVCRMLDFLLCLQGANGSAPAIGDSDGGFLLPLSQREPDDLRGVFSAGAALFGRDDYAWASGGLAPEIPWLLGVPGVKAFDALLPSPPRSGPSHLFPEGGYAVMSSGWARDAHRIVFDVGPLGCPVSSGHGHADLLSVQCTSFGEPILVDPGTYTYTAEREWRDHFRSTRAHNTVTVDGKDQAEPRGPFGWTRRPSARILRWESTEAWDLAEADHDAYGPIRHRRLVLFSKPDRFVVVDDVLGAGDHSVDLRYQFAPLPVFLEEGWVRAFTRSGRGFLLGVVSKAPLERRLLEGELEPPQGWVSPQYGERRPAPCLVLSTRINLPLRIVTLLLPVPDSQTPPPDLLPIWDENGWPTALGVGEAPLVLLDTPADGATLQTPPFGGN
jgi:hypothetical protein